MSEENGLLKVWFYPIKQTFNDNRGFQMGEVRTVEHLEDLVPGDGYGKLIIRKMYCRSAAEAIQLIGNGAMGPIRDGLLDCDFMVGLDPRYQSPDR